MIIHPPAFWAGLRVLIVLSPLALTGAALCELWFSRKRKGGDRHDAKKEEARSQEEAQH